MLKEFGPQRELAVILGIGTDLANIERIEATLARFGDRFRNRVFTEREQRKAEQLPRGGIALRAGRNASACEMRGILGIGRPGFHTNAIDLALGFMLLALQGLSELIKRAAFIAGAAPDSIGHVETESKDEIGHEIEEHAAHVQEEVR